LSTGIGGDDGSSGMRLPRSLRAPLLADGDHVGEVGRGADLERAPVFLGNGIRLFDGVDAQRITVNVVDAIHSPMVTHLSYAVSHQEMLGE